MFSSVWRLILNFVQLVGDWYFACFVYCINCCRMTSINSKYIISLHIFIVHIFGTAFWINVGRLIEEHCCVSMNSRSCFETAHCSLHWEAVGDVILEPVLTFVSSAVASQEGGNVTSDVSNILEMMNDCESLEPASADAPSAILRLEYFCLCSVGI